MKIAQDTVVFIDYILNDGDGNLLEKSDREENFAYLHGYGQLPTKLEEALEGKEAGARVQVSLSPEEGFGDRDEKQIISVPRDRFPEDEEIVNGLQVEAETDHGHQVFTIIDIQDNTVTLDGNHPYAGVDLDFDVTVAQVRAATEEELDHGHVHTGDHHH
ncbi:peptidylprolyl isomerase [Marispirochaeta aestuarii]|uniref:Peptidyl-prolyl cis-trans isomerase n=1 Tax=Marispirochaeta aestuarii TaxID=1963862 RepID=A0A1Y1RXC7_9SPIO|nr:peptidylprolyl isomerase [Marispirochaeta aestuarii]ORC34915.1 peptidylprolyl isomerase [Marispirochaeta aestuarii]